MASHIDLQQFGVVGGFSHGSISELCLEAAAWEDVSEFKEAARCLIPVWAGAGHSPQVEDLDSRTAAEVLLRAGSLTAWLGDSQLQKGIQDEARNLLSAALTKFESLGDKPKAAEAQNGIAITYWREGAYDNARAVLEKAFKQQRGGDEYLKLILTGAMVETWDGHLDVARRLYHNVSTLSRSCGNYALRARYHFSYGLVLKKIGEVDGALRQYNESLRCLDVLGNVRLRGNVENNIGTLYLSANRYEEAHEHLTKARDLFRRCDDLGSAAQVDDSEAQVYLAEGRLEEAEPVAYRAVAALLQGDNIPALIEALETQGTISARLQKIGDAIQAFTHAEELAAANIGSERASKVSLCMIDELSSPAYLESGLPFDEAVHRFESQLLRAALQESDGNMKEAAVKLGLKYDTLRWMLNNRHRDLLPDRSPIVPRKRSIIKKVRPKAAILKFTGKS